MEEIEQTQEVRPRPVRTNVPCPMCSSNQTWRLSMVLHCKVTIIRWCTEPDCLYAEKLHRDDPTCR